MPGELTIEARAPARAGGGDVPSTWDAAFAMLAETMAECFENAQAERSREIGELNARLDDLAALNRQLVDRLAEADTERAAIAERAQRLDDLAHAAGGLAVRLEERDADVAAVRRELTAAMERLEASDGYVGRLAADVQDARTVAQQAVTAHEGNTKRVRQLGDDHADHVKATAATDAACSALRDDLETFRGLVNGELDAVRGAATDHAREVDQISARLDEVVQNIATVAATAGEQVDEIVRGVELANQVASAAQDLHARVQVTMQQTVSGFLVDHAGDLVAIRANGEQTSLGRVVGRDGAPGPAHTPAVEIVAVKSEAGRLVFTRTDGREISCELQPSVIIPSEPTYDGHTVEDLKKMRAQGDTFVKIGKAAGITPQYAARLIKR